MLYAENITIDCTIEPSTINISIKDLTSTYNKAKEESTKDSSKLTSKRTLKGIEEVKDVITNAMLQIEEFVKKGKEESTVTSVKSKAIATIDKNNRWIGKWINNASKNLKIEAIHQSTITDLLTTLKTNIETKREEVIEFTDELVTIKNNALQRLSIFEDIDKKTMQLLESYTGPSREKFDAKRLATMVKATIVKTQSDIKSYIDPLIVAAEMSIDQIHSFLPSLENDLQSVLAIKTFQEELQLLNSMVNATIELTRDAGKIIHDSVKSTTLTSLQMLATNGIDIKDYEQFAKEEVEYQQKVKSVLDSTIKTIDNNFDRMIKVQDTMLVSSQQIANPLIK